MSTPGSSWTAERLNWLFDVVRPAHNRAYTAQDVATALGATQEQWDSREITAALTDLRSGRSGDLSRAQLDAVAVFFGATPSYFGADEQALIEAQTGLVWTQLSQGGVEDVRLCRIAALDLAQWLDVGLLLMDCVRSVEVDEDPRSRNQITS